MKNVIVKGLANFLLKNNVRNTRTPTITTQNYSIFFIKY